jgi:hypothetical protein
MPTRRILELAVITAILMRPVFGLARIWAGKTMLHTNNGSISHGTAEIVAAIV